MSPKKCKPLVPMETRSRAKAKKNAESQPPVLAKRIRKDTSPHPNDGDADGAALADGCLSVGVGSGSHLKRFLPRSEFYSKIDPNHTISTFKTMEHVELFANSEYENENEESLGLANSGQEDFTIHNAIELLNTNYDNWKSHFTGTSSDDDSIKAFISYENLHYPDTFADLANKCGIDVLTLTNAFENGLDITHEIISHVSNSSDENSVHTDQIFLKKKAGRPLKKRGKTSIDRQTKEKNQAKTWKQNYHDNETQEDRNKRLSQENARISSRRSNETQDERNKRLSQDNARIITRRSNETQEDRNIRLSEDRERHNALINNRTQAENIQKESENLVGTLTNVNDIIPFSLGSFDFSCKDCGALHFKMEASLKELKKRKENRTYDMCCSLGKIASRLSSCLKVSVFEKACETS